MNAIGGSTSEADGPAFHARTGVLAGTLAGREVEPFLSGLLIGAEVAEALREVAADLPLALVADDVLAESYRHDAGDQALIGAGTVVESEDVSKVAAAGARFVVSPNTEVSVIAATKRAGLVSLPGVQTPTEAFAAIKAGADMLKYFPGEAATPAILRALFAVIPKSAPLVLVGGVSAHSIEQWADPPLAGFGVGGSLYKSGDAPAVVASRARALVAALRACGRM